MNIIGRTLLAVILLAAPAFAQFKQQSTVNFTSSGTTQLITDTLGSTSQKFGITMLGSPATLSVTVQGCIRGPIPSVPAFNATCDSAAITYTTTSNGNTATINGTYDFYQITVSWTGGTNVSVSVGATLIAMGSPSSGSGSGCLDLTGSFGMVYDSATGQCQPDTNVTTDGSGDLQVITLSMPNIVTTFQIQTVAGPNASTIDDDTALYTGGTGTTTHPHWYADQATAPSTWSTLGTEFGINAPSGFTGNFLDFHLNGGASLAKLDYLGDLTVTSCVGCSTTPISTLHAYGDSITAGFGDPSYTADAAPTQLGPYSGWVAVVAGRINGYTQNLAHTGDEAADTEKLLFNSLVPDYLQPPLNAIMIGTNNSNLEATGSCTGGGVNGGCRNNFQYQINALIGWAGVADYKKLYAQKCTGAGWAADTTTYTGLSLMPMDSDTANSTATCPAVTTGAVIQWAWIANTTVSGCANLVMDGTTTLDTECSTGFNSASVLTQNGLAFSTFLKTVSTTVTPGSHTFTIVHDSSSGTSKYFEWAWLGFPDLPNLNPDATTSKQPPVLMIGVPEQASNANAAITLAYDTIVSSSVTAMQAVGITNVQYCSSRTNINFSDTTEWSSGTSNAALHPTRKGSAILAYDIYNCLKSLQ